VVDRVRTERTAVDRTGQVTMKKSWLAICRVVSTPISKFDSANQWPHKLEVIF
jgi:hypothetical protein